tara:strand:+ start:115 stop:243 length:129 start_codon:yes stop_codon:yes gene_type:complete
MSILLLLKIGKEPLFVTKNLIVVFLRRPNLEEELVSGRNFLK